MYFRPLPILSIFTAFALWLLISLGNWQWARYNYKLNLENTPPAKAISLESAMQAPKDYTIVYVNGVLGKQYSTINIAENGKYGKRIFTSISQNGKNYCAEIGFFNNDSFNDKNLNLGKTVSLKGVIKQSRKPNSFFPNNNNNSKLYYWPDCNQIAKDLNVKFDNDYFFTPEKIDPDMNGQTIQNPYADPKGISYVEPARHLGYALTWWGLSISLISVYLALHFKQNRLGLTKK